MNKKLYKKPTITIYALQNPVLLADSTPIWEGPMGARITDVDADEDDQMP